MGYDGERVVGEIDPLTICQLCTKILEDPVFLDCVLAAEDSVGHVFCRKCVVEKFVEASSLRTVRCPIDGERFKSNNKRSLLGAAPTKVLEKMAKIELKCDNLGCSKIIPYNDLSNHVLNCASELAAAKTQNAAVPLPIEEPPVQSSKSKIAEEQTSESAEVANTAQDHPMEIETPVLKVSIPLTEHLHVNKPELMKMLENREEKAPFPVEGKSIHREFKDLQQSYRKRIHTLREKHAADLAYLKRDFENALGELRGKFVLELNVNGSTQNGLHSDPSGGKAFRVHGLNKHQYDDLVNEIDAATIDIDGVFQPTLATVNVNSVTESTLDVVVLEENKTSEKSNVDTQNNCAEKEPVELLNVSGNAQASCAFAQEAPLLRQLCVQNQEERQVEIPDQRILQRQSSLADSQPSTSLSSPILAQPPPLILAPRIATAIDVIPAVEQPVKRKRGRPRIHPIIERKKRGPGRPPGTKNTNPKVVQPRVQKLPFAKTLVAPAPVLASETGLIPIKRRPGRPRKNTTDSQLSVSSSLSLNASDVATRSTRSSRSTSSTRSDAPRESGNICRKCVSKGTASRPYVCTHLGNIATEEEAKLFRHNLRRPVVKILPVNVPGEKENRSDFRKKRKSVTSESPLKIGAGLEKQLPKDQETVDLQLRDRTPSPAQDNGNTEKGDANQAIVLESGEPVILVMEQTLANGGENNTGNGGASEETVTVVFEKDLIISTTEAKEVSEPTDETAGPSVDVEKGRNSSSILVKPSAALEPTVHSLITEKEHVPLDTANKSSAGPLQSVPVIVPEAQDKPTTKSVDDKGPPVTTETNTSVSPPLEKRKRGRPRLLDSRKKKETKSVDHEQGYTTPTSDYAPDTPVSMKILESPRTPLMTSTPRADVTYQKGNGASKQHSPSHPVSLPNEREPELPQQRFVLPPIETLQKRSSDPSKTLPSAPPLPTGHHPGSIGTHQRLQPSAQNCASSLDLHGHAMGTSYRGAINSNTPSKRRSEGEDILQAAIDAINIDNNFNDEYSQPQKKRCVPYPRYQDQLQSIICDQLPMTSVTLPIPLYGRDTRYTPTQQYAGMPRMSAPNIPSAMGMQSPATLFDRSRCVGRSASEMNGSPSKRSTLSDCMISEQTRNFLSPRSVPVPLFPQRQLSSHGELGANAKSPPIGDVEFAADSRMTPSNSSDGSSDCGQSFSEGTSTDSSLPFRKRGRVSKRPTDDEEPSQPSGSIAPEHEMILNQFLLMDDKTSHSGVEGRQLGHVFPGTPATKQHSSHSQHAHLVQARQSSEKRSAVEVNAGSKTNGGNSYTTLDDPHSHVLLSDLSGTEARSSHKQPSVAHGSRSVISHHSSPSQRIPQGHAQVVFPSADRHQAQLSYMSYGQNLGEGRSWPTPDPRSMGASFGYNHMAMQMFHPHNPQQGHAPPPYGTPHFIQNLVAPSNGRTMASYRTSPQARPSGGSMASGAPPSFPDNCYNL